MIVTCATCGADVYEVVGDVYVGKVISSADFKGINGYESPKMGDRIECPACDSTEGMRLAIMGLGEQLRAKKSKGVK